MASDIYIYIFIPNFIIIVIIIKKKLSNLWIQLDPTDPCGLGWVEPL